MHVISWDLKWSHWQIVNFYAVYLTTDIILLHIIYQQRKFVPFLHYMCELMYWLTQVTFCRKSLSIEVGPHVEVLSHCILIPACLCSPCSLGTWSISCSGSGTGRRCTCPRSPRRRPSSCGTATCRRRRRSWPWATGLTWTRLRYQHKHSTTHDVCFSGVSKCILVRTNALLYMH